MSSYIFPALFVFMLILIFSNFRTSGTKKITDELFSIRCAFVNFYALKINDGYALFDAGMNAAIAKYGLRRHRIAPESVKHVFLTHTDYDHAGGLSAFPNAAVYISADEEQMIDGRTARRGFIYNSRIKSYRAMKDGESAAAGGRRVKLINAPGHTPGSAAYLIDDRILVTGDILRINKKGEIKPFLWLMNKDHAKDIESAEMIRGIADGADYVLTGHTGFYSKKGRAGQKK